MSLLALAVGSPSAKADVPLTRADIETIVNRVEFISRGRQARVARLSDFMAVGDTLRTAAQSQAQLRFNDGSLARVGERATFRFIPNTRNFRLSDGTMLLLIPPNRGRSTIQTPSAITGIQGSAVVVRHIEDRNLTIVMALTNNPAGPMTVTTSACGSTNGVETSGCVTEHPLYAGQMALVQDNQVQILEFDLPAFYETSPLIDGLELNNPSPDVSLGSDLDQVRAETLEALAREYDFSDATVLNPALVGLNGSESENLASQPWLLSPSSAETTTWSRARSGAVGGVGLVGVSPISPPSRSTAPMAPPTGVIPGTPPPTNRPAEPTPPPTTSPNVPVGSPPPASAPPVATPTPPATPPVATPTPPTTPPVAPPVATPTPPVAPPVATPTPPVTPPIATPTPPVVAPTPPVTPPVAPPTPPVVAPTPPTPPSVVPPPTPPVVIPDPPAPTPTPPAPGPPVVQPEPPAPTPTPPTPVPGPPVVQPEPPAPIPNPPSPVPEPPVQPEPPTPTPPVTPPEIPVKDPEVPPVLPPTPPVTGPNPGQPGGPAQPPPFDPRIPDFPADPPADPPVDFGFEAPVK